VGLRIRVRAVCTFLRHREIASAAPRGLPVVRGDRVPAPPRDRRATQRPGAAIGRAPRRRARGRRPRAKVRPILRGDRRARHQRQRRPLRAVRAGRPQPPERGPGGAVLVLAVQRAAAARPGPDHRHQPVGAVARRGVGGRGGARPGWRDPGHHQRPELAAGGSGRRDAGAVDRRRAVGGRDQDLYQPAHAPGHAQRRAGRRRRAARRTGPPDARRRRGGGRARPGPPPCPGRAR